MEEKLITLATETKIGHRVNFIEAIKQYWKRYIDFKGNSSRSEFWFATLFLVLVGFIVFIADAVRSTSSPDPDASLLLFTNIWFLLTAIPSLSLAIRRIRDAGLSPWLILVGLVPLAGSIALLVFYLLPSKNGASATYVVGAHESESDIIVDGEVSDVNEVTLQVSEEPVASVVSSQESVPAPTNLATVPVETKDAVKEQEPAFSTADSSLDARLKTFPVQSEKFSVADDYEFFAQWTGLKNKEITKFTRFKQQNNPEYAGSPEAKKAMRLNIESEANAAVEVLNAGQRSLLERLDKLMAASPMGGDDAERVSLKRNVSNLPEFTSDWLAPIPQPGPLTLRPEPILEIPERKGFWSLPFMTKSFQKKVARLEEEHAADHSAWEEEKVTLPERQKKQLEHWMVQEKLRAQSLEYSRARYESAVQEWLKGVEAQNAAVDEILRRATSGETEAVSEYFNHLFAMIQYPKEFRPVCEFKFDADSRELILTADLPSLEALTEIQTFKYVKTGMAIEGVAMTGAKLNKAYQEVLAQLVARLGFEIATADRGGVCNAITVHGLLEDRDPLEGKDIKVLIATCTALSEKWRSLKVQRLTGMAALSSLNGKISAKPAEKEKISNSGSIGSL